MFDNRVYETREYKYMQSIVKGERIACKELILQCKRLLNDIERSKTDDYEFYFDVDKSVGIDGFIGLLKFPNGRKKGEPIYLAEFQNFIVKTIFCWREKNDSEVVRFNDCLILIARKNGKSFLCAILGIVAMMIENLAEVANGAVALSQAKIIVTQAQQLLRTNPQLAKHFKIYKSHIEFKGSTFKPLSSNALDGANFNVVLVDEANETSRELYESMTSGFAQRKSYQSYYLTTEYPLQKKSGWFDELREMSVKVSTGVVENERMVSFIYKIDNAEEVNNKDMYVKANPIIEEQGVDFWEKAYIKACSSPREMLNFLIKNMNFPQVTEEENSYLNMDKWKECCSKKSIDWTGIDVNVGIDLSKTTDLTSVSFTGVDNNGNVLVHSHGFLPEETLTSGNRREKIDYRKLHDEGYCTIIEGSIIDYGIVKEYIMSVEEKFGCNINTIQFDTYNALQMMSDLSNEGFTVVEAKQNKMTLSYPTKTFREKVYSGQVKYDKNPLLDWCVSCAVTDVDNNGNEQLSKNKAQKNNKRIDLIAAVIFSYVETVKIKPKFDLDQYAIY